MSDKKIIDYSVLDRQRNDERAVAVLDEQFHERLVVATGRSSTGG